MSHDALLWLSFILIGLATTLPRASFIVLGNRVSLPSVVQRALRYAPAAALAAIVAPGGILPKSSTYPIYDMVCSWDPQRGSYAFNPIEITSEHTKDAAEVGGRHNSLCHGCVCVRKRHQHRIDLVQHLGNGTDRRPDDRRAAGQCLDRDQPESFQLCRRHHHQIRGAIVVRKAGKVDWYED